MDRATLLQIFQSRLERSDYSKLQKQGRTFYQEARRQASNTQARYIFVSSLFFFCRAEEVYASLPCIRMYVCMYVCLYVCMCVSRVYSPFPCRRRPVSFRFPCVLCTCYQRIHWFSRGCSRGCCLAFRNLQMYFSRVHLFYHFLFFRLSLVFVPCIFELPLPTYYS